MFPSQPPKRHQPAVKKPAVAEPVQVSVEAPAPEEWPKAKIDRKGFIPPKPARPQDFKDTRLERMRWLTVLVSEKTGVSVLEIASHRRKPAQVKARQIVFWLAKNFTTLSLPRIAHRVGRRDHTTALYGVRKVQAVIERLNIEMADCPVVMAERLWAADWPKVSR
jgi:hypothetical protein